MRTLGETLRQARLDKGVSLGDAAADTRIRRQYLEALEAEDVASLPPPVYTRGLLRTYAEYLGLNPHVMVDLYQPVPKREASPPLRPAVPRVAIPREIPLRPVLYVLGAVVGVVLVVWAWTQLQAAAAAIREQQGIPAVRAPGTPTLRPGVPTQLPIAVASPSPTPEPTPEPPPSPTPVVDGILVEFRTTARVYVEAAVDGRQVLAETLPAGTQRSLPLGQDVVVMRVSSGTAVQVVVNGQAQGAPASPGPVEYTWRR